MKKTIFISILIAAFATQSFAHCPIPQWCPSAPLHQILCSGEQIEEIEFPSVMGRTLFLEWWSDGTRHISVGTPEGISVSGTTTDFREYGHPVAISGRPVDPGTHHYTVSDVCGRILLSGSITTGDIPKFTIQPDTVGLVTTQDIAFCPDTLSVTFTGTTPITLQWYYTTANDYTTGLTEFGASEIATGSPGSAAIPIAVVSPTLPNDEIGIRYYHLVATNICGTVRSDISGVRQVVVPPYPTGCNFVTSERNLVTITSASFTTDSVWTIPGTDGRPTQIWSDAVISPQCTPRGDSYNGGDFVGPYNVDCRNATNGFDGHYFSWCAVMKFADILCPGDWRVPTSEEFAVLHQNLGYELSAIPFYTHAIIANTFMGTTGTYAVTENRGGTWGGARYTSNTIYAEIPVSYYWSSSEYNASKALCLYYHSTGVNPHYCNPINENSDGSKAHGNALRCVRDVP